MKKQPAKDQTISALDDAMISSDIGSSRLRVTVSTQTKSFTNLQYANQ